MFGRKKSKVSEMYERQFEQEISQFAKAFQERMMHEHIYAIIKKQGKFNLVIGFIKSTESWDAVKVQSRISGWDMCCKVVDADDVLDLNGNPKIMRRMIQAINGVI